ncbi:hypothetical protein B9Z55_002370 [Caenorhabditis nigoni]|uniref:Uncharacterized protein n=1 Tax=Caenorhabditis nigoni TaxID=1611254 RepID=A0A2G5VK37_9PELO|nr:hypothetical protein B9Z55_002370 [Caenorhabditis nigoni]
MTRQAPEVRKTCPAKSDGPMDITTTTTDWQKEFQRTLEFQTQRHSVRMLSPRGGDQAAGTFQSRHLLSRSSTQGVTSTQIKQTVIMRRST